MVVLSLVLGLSEQDDFANIPDLQATGNQQNQNSQGDKRYEEEAGASVAANSERLTSEPLRVIGVCKEAPQCCPWGCILAGLARFPLPA